MSGNWQEFQKYYQILEVRPYARWEAIEWSYKELRKKKHPDKLKQILRREPTEQEKKQATENFQKITEAYNILKEAYKGEPEINPQLEQWTCDFCARNFNVNNHYARNWEHQKPKIIKNSEQVGYIYCCSNQCLEKAVNCYECGEVGKQGRSFKHSKRTNAYYCETCYSKLEGCSQCQKKLTGTNWYIKEDKPERFCSENCASEWLKNNQPKNTKIRFWTKCKKCSKKFEYTSDNEEEVTQKLNQQLDNHYATDHPETTPETTLPPISQEPSTSDNSRPIPQPQKDNSNGKEPNNKNDNSSNDPQKLIVARKQAWQKIKKTLEKYHVSDEELKELKELKETSWQTYLKNLDSEGKINELVRKIESGAKRISVEKAGSQNQKSNGLSRNAKIGIGVGVVSGVLVLVGIIIVKIRQRKR